MRSDCASRPTRGSRLVGLLSMIMTTVAASGLLEHPVKAKTRPTISSATNRVGTAAPGRAVAAKGGMVFTGHLCIRDLSQDDRPLRSSGRRNVRRQPLPRLIGKQGEGRGFFGVGRQPEFVGEANPQAERVQLL